MDDKAIQLIMGEMFYKFDDGKAIYSGGLKYRQKYVDNNQDLHSGQIYLNCIYSAFMEGYRVETVCYDILPMVVRGFLIPGHNERESFDIAAAILQYGVEELKSAKCAVLMSTLYRDGTRGIIPQDTALQFQWLKQAADLGDSGAQVTVGCRLLKEQKRYEAEKYWLAAANQGNVDAMHNLGILYQGEGFWNYPEAGHWFEQAARKGSKESENILNKNYLYDQKHQKWLKRL